MLCHVRLLYLKLVHGGLRCVWAYPQGSSAAAKASGAVKDISPTLLTILDVICTCLRKQSSTFLAANVQYIVQVRFLVHLEKAPLPMPRSG